MLSACALEIDYSNDSKVAAGIKIGSSTHPSLDIEIGASYRPFRYIGVNASFTYITPFKSRKDFIDNIPPKGEIYSKINNYKDGCYGFAAKAGLQFTTPAVMVSKNEMGVSLRVSPGITIPIPTNKTIAITNTERIIIEDDQGEHEYYIYHSKNDVTNSGAKFCYWYVRSELVLEFEEQWEFCVGYTYSNIDLYGGSRNIEVNNTHLVISDKKIHHTISLGLTYKF